jgi:hypothetical protein
VATHWKRICTLSNQKLEMPGKGAWGQTESASRIHGSTATSPSTTSTSGGSTGGVASLTALHHQQQQNYHFPTAGRIRRLSSDDSGIRYYPNVVEQVDQHLINQRGWRGSNDDSNQVKLYNFFESLCDLLK